MGITPPRLSTGPPHSLGQSQPIENKYTATFLVSFLPEIRRPVPKDIHVILPALFTPFPTPFTTKIETYFRVFPISL